MSKPQPITYSAAPEPEGKIFTCKRCKRQYAYPKPGDRPIRCECGWWYENKGGSIHEAYWERISTYREPPSKLF